MSGMYPSGYPFDRTQGDAYETHKKTDHETREYLIAVEQV